MYDFWIFTQILDFQSPYCQVLSEWEVHYLAAIIPSHLIPISGDHKAICGSWIKRDWETLCPHFAQSVKRNATLSRAQPTIPQETCSNSLLLILWNIPRDIRMTIENHSQTNSISVFKMYNLERLFDGFRFFVKICPKMIRLEYRLLFALHVKSVM